MQLSFCQAVAERDALVEHETIAFPAALLLRNGFEIFQDAALEVEDVLESARQHIGARLFAADAAGAEHRDLGVARGIERAIGELLELAEALDAGIDRALEGAYFYFEIVAGGEQHHAG